MQYDKLDKAQHTLLDSSQITVVFQGNVTPFSKYSSAGPNFAENVRLTREALPEAKIILSTWQGVQLPENIGVDEVVYSPDPGALPNIKLDGKVPNNINRQIVSTFNGLKRVKTPYALKLRTDNYLTHAGFIAYFEQFRQRPAQLQTDPVMVCTFFTIDSTVYEHMPYHISDWFQFGRTESLKEWWDIPLMSGWDATYYERNAHRNRPNFFDKKFRTRLAVEQHIVTPYAKKRGFSVPTLHNEQDSDILKAYQNFLAQYCIVLEPERIGLNFPKYQWAIDSHFFAMDCISFPEWYKLYVNFWDIKKPDSHLIKQANQRFRQKQITKYVAKIVDPIANYWYGSKNKILFSGVEFLVQKLFKV